MGCSGDAKCRKCGKEFEYSDGGGFFFHLVRCDRCGKTKSILFSKLGDLHLRFLKGLPGPYAYATRDMDRKVQEEHPGEPIDEEEYIEGIEKLAGNCRCRGKYRFSAPIRCPACLSDDVELCDVTTFYD